MAYSGHRLSSREDHSSSTHITNGQPFSAVPPPSRNASVRRAILESTVCSPRQVTEVLHSMKHNHEQSPSTSTPNTPRGDKRQWRFLTSAATDLTSVPVTPHDASSTLLFESSRPGTSSTINGHAMASCPPVPTQRLSTPYYHQDGVVDYSARSLPGRLTRGRVPLMDPHPIDERISHSQALHHHPVPVTVASGLAIEEAAMLIPTAPAPRAKATAMARTLPAGGGTSRHQRQTLPWEEPFDHLLHRRPLRAPSMTSMLSPTSPAQFLELMSAPLVPSDVVVSAAVSLETSQVDVDLSGRRVRFVLEKPNKMVPAALGSVRKRNSFREAMAGTDEQRLDFGRRSSRALFLERMDILKRTLESTVDDVTAAFEFDKNPDQLRALNEIIKGVDGAVLGQEYLTAHPMQPTLSLVGRSNPQMEALISSMKRPVNGAGTSGGGGHGGTSSRYANTTSALDMQAVSAALHSAVPGTTLSPMDSPMRASNGLGRQTSSYYLQVAEEKKKTGAAAVGNQLYVAAEALEQRNASQLGLLIPKHDTALSELEVLGLL